MTVVLAGTHLDFLTLTHRHQWDADAFGLVRVVPEWFGFVDTSLPPNKTTRPKIVVLCCPGVGQAERVSKCCVEKSSIFDRMLEMEISLCKKGTRQARHDKDKENLAHVRWSDAQKPLLILGFAPSASWRS